MSTTALGPAAADTVPAPSAPLIVLSGPSGVGKDTVLRHLRQHRPEVWVSVSATTRTPRPGEIDGVHYHFLPPAEFEELAAQGQFLEWAQFAGHHYGTPRRAVEERLAAGTPVLLEIELQGARQVRAALPQALLVFLAPPSWEELVRRLTGRGTESPEAVRARLEAARVELAAESEFDLTLVNTSVPQVAAELVALTTSHTAEGMPSAVRPSASQPGAAAVDPSEPIA